MPIFEVRILFDYEMDLKLYDARRILQEQIEDYDMIRVDREPSIHLFSVRASNSENLVDVLENFVSRRVRFDVCLDRVRKNAINNVICLESTSSSVLPAFRSDLLGVLRDSPHGFEVVHTYPDEWVPCCELVDGVNEMPENEDWRKRWPSFPFEGLAMKVSLVLFSTSRLSKASFRLVRPAVLSENPSGDFIPDKVSERSSKRQKMAENYKLKLFFDQSLKHHIREISTSLKNLGITLLTVSQPHITLLASAFCDSQRLRNVIENLASKKKQMPIVLSSIEINLDAHSTTFSLFLAPTPSQSLFDFHTWFCDAMEKEGIDICDEYRPGFWIPRCPIALEVPKIQMARLYDYARDMNLIGAGYLAEIGLEDQKEVVSFKLKES